MKRRPDDRRAAAALRGGIMLFQFLTCLLLGVKGGTYDYQALALCLALPAATFLLSSITRKFFRSDDTVMLLTLFLVGVGITTLQDIAKSPQTPREQFIYFGLGAAAMLMAMVFIRRLRSWEKWTYWAMGGSLILLASPLLIGTWQYGAKNWIEISGFSMQPSEFVKPALVFVMAVCLSGRTTQLNRMLALAFAGALCVLLLLERDLGALLLYYSVTLILYYASTSNLPMTGLGAAAGAGGAYAAYSMFPYVQRRMAAFVDPWSDPLDKGYQIIQALIAIGSGGFFGMGLGLGLPRNIPLYHSDFIFAAICEEFGCLFALCLICVYLLIAMRGVSIAASARSSFHALIVFGVSVQLALQALLIIGGNTKLIPLTGVTLPLISSGGSSLVASMASLGLLLGVSSINRQYDLEAERRLAAREEEPA